MYIYKVEFQNFFQRKNLRHFLPAFIHFQNILEKGLEKMILFIWKIEKNEIKRHRLLNIAEYQQTEKELIWKHWSLC